MKPDDLLDAFFGDGNLISRAKVDSTPALQELLTDLSEDLSIPTVLPRRLSEETVEWFVLCGDDAALRRAQAELQGFVGPTYASWDGARASLDRNDPVEGALLDFTDGRVIRFETGSDLEFKECWSAVQLMRKVWHQRPATELRQIRTGAALVREFELAVAAGDPGTASHRLEEIRSRGLLGAENLRFLEIRQAAAAGRWADIAGAADLADLARIRRPWVVTEDLLTGMYRARLAPFQSSGDVAGAIAATTELAEQFPDLLSTRGPLRSADVLKIFALRFAVPGAQGEARIRGLLDIPGLGADDRSWISSVAEVTAPPTAPRPDAREALAAGDVDEALALALDGAPTATRAELLVECAFELHTLESAEAAIAALEALKASERDALLERRLVAFAVDALRKVAEPANGRPTTVPHSWTAWLERLANDPQWKAAEAVAVLGELEYSAEDLADPTAAAELSNFMLAAGDSAQRHILRDALPQIVGWLERQDPDPALARPVHNAILTLVALDSAWGESTLEVSYNATEALLKSGLDPTGYSELLGQLELVWERMASRAHVAWLADLLELLELYPGPRAALLEFVATNIRTVIDVADRLDPALVEAIARSCSAISAPDIAQALRARAPESHRPDADADKALDGRLVGIYTLTPQVAVRARDAITRRFQGVRVEIDSSHVSTSSLEHLAATADYLIVSIRSAKHAATDAIDRHRPREMPTLIPSGRGSSRMVEALIAAVGSAGG